MTLAEHWLALSRMTAEQYRDRRPSGGFCYRPDCGARVAPPIVAVCEGHGKTTITIRHRCERGHDMGALVMEE